jgi:hypothetical protein
MSARKLQHYFEAHRVRVLTNQPLHDIFGNRDLLGRISKWVMKLLEHIIDFEKEAPLNLKISLQTIQNQYLHRRPSTWITLVGILWQSLGNVGAGALAILISPSWIKLRYAMRLQFTKETEKCTKNIAKYKALLLGSGSNAQWEFKVAS